MCVCGGGGRSEVILILILLMRRTHWRPLESNGTTIKPSFIRCSLEALTGIRLPPVWYPRSLDTEGRDRVMISVMIEG